MTREELEVIRGKMVELQNSRLDTAYIAKSVALSLYVEPLIAALDTAWEDLIGLDVGNVITHLAHLRLVKRAEPGCSYCVRGLDEALAAAIARDSVLTAAERGAQIRADADSIFAQPFWAALGVRP